MIRGPKRANFRPLRNDHVSANVRPSGECPQCLDQSRRGLLGRGDAAPYAALRGGAGACRGACRADPEEARRHHRRRVRCVALRSGRAGAGRAAQHDAHRRGGEGADRRGAAARRGGRRLGPLGRHQPGRARHRDGAAALRGGAAADRFAARHRRGAGEARAQAPHHADDGPHPDAAGDAARLRSEGRRLGVRHRPRDPSARGELRGDADPAVRRRVRLAVGARQESGAGDEGAGKGSRPRAAARAVVRAKGARRRLRAGRGAGHRRPRQGGEGHRADDAVRAAGGCRAVGAGQGRLLDHAAQAQSGRRRPRADCRRAHRAARRHHRRRHAAGERACAGRLAGRMAEPRRPARGARLGGRGHRRGGAGPHRLRRPHAGQSRCNQRRGAGRARDLPAGREDGQGQGRRAGREGAREGRLVRRRARASSRPSFPTGRRCWATRRSSSTGCWPTCGLPLRGGSRRTRSSLRAARGGGAVLRRRRGQRQRDWCS